MGNYWSNALGGLLSLNCLIGFILGAGAVRLYYWVKCNRWNHQHPDDVRHMAFKPLVMLWSLIFLITGYIGVQQYQLRSATAECLHEFYVSQAARSLAGDATDQWSDIKTKALGDWLRQILNPPPDIARLRMDKPDDPRIQQWGLDITEQYSQIIDDAEQQQQAALADRKSHPLPDPSCGKTS